MFGLIRFDINYGYCWRCGDAGRRVVTIAGGGSFVLEIVPGLCTEAFRAVARAP